MIIAVANQKGGVGKTTVTANLGAALALVTDQPILLVDLDPQAALTICCGLSPGVIHLTMYDVMLSSLSIHEVRREVWPKVHLAPSTIDLAGAEIELVGEIGREMILSEKLSDLLAVDSYEYVLVDCPPSLGLLTVNALTAAQGVLIPVSCQYLAYRGMQQLRWTVEKVQKRSNPALKVLGLLPSLYDPRTLHAREVLTLLQKEHPGPFCNLPVRTRVALADAAVAGQSIFAYDPKSDSAETFLQIAQEVENYAQAHASR